MGFTMAEQIDDFQKELEAEVEVFQKAVERAVEKEARKIKVRSQKLAPVDTGFLQSSARVFDQGDASYVIAYLASYAMPVHERTEVPHENGQAKFLEQAFKDHSSEFLPNVKKSIKRDLR